MKRVLFTTVLISVFMGGGTVISSLAASEHEAHHLAGTKSVATTSKQGMTQKPCLAAPDAGSMSQMMGMMGQGMAHMFYLDSVDELGLSVEQVSKLKTRHLLTVE